MKVLQGEEEVKKYIQIKFKDYSNVVFFYT